MQLSANIISEEKDDSCSVPEHKFQDDTSSRKLCMVMIIAFTVICVLASIIVVIYTVKMEHCHNDTVPDPDSGPRHIGSSIPEELQIHSREEWGGYPPRSSRNLLHPTPLVVISDTVTEPCNNFRSCSETVKSIQYRHMENYLSDIGYNFLVGGDGSVYEGRGWDISNMHTGFVRRCNIAISFIGTFKKDHPSKAQVNSALRLLSLGVQLGKISTDYKILAMNQTSSIENPGPLLFTVIKQWVHYSNETKQDTGHCPLWL